MEKIQLSYASGPLVQEGDWVRIDRGNSLGRVREVINSLDQARDQGLEARGVVVDAPPNGLVFLSDQLLREEPLQFVRRGPSEEVRFHLAATLGLGAVILLPAMYSFLSAFLSAVGTGQVTVISLGYNHTARETVPWQAGWARFAGPIVLLVALCVVDGSRGATLRWWLSGAAAVAGLALLAFSSWFTTVNGSLAWLALVASIAVAATIDRRYGRGATFLFLLVCVLSLVWWKFGNAI